MRGRTHVAAGIAASLAVLLPSTATGCLCAVAGGALGGWIADIDVRTEGRAHDRLQGAALAVGIAGGALAIDAHGGGEALTYLVDHLGLAVAVGIAAFAALCVLGAHTKHRSFTHSLLGLALYTGSLSLFMAPLAPSFCLGYATHLALDMLNKQRVSLLYPLARGWCLGLCHSAGLVDTLLCATATVASGVLLWVCCQQFL